MKGRLLVCAWLLVSISLVLSGQTRKAAARRKPFSVVEATIPEMRAAMEQGRLTSREIVRQYLVRIATYEDMLHAAITINPKALEPRGSARP